MRRGSFAFPDEVLPVINGTLVPVFAGECLHLGPLTVRCRLVHWWTDTDGMDSGGHRHRDAELALPVRGTHRYAVAGGGWQRIACRRQLVLVPPGRPHRRGASAGGQRLACFLEVEAADGRRQTDVRAFWQHVAATGCSVPLGPATTDAVDRLAIALRTAGPLAIPRCRLALGQVLLESLASFGAGLFDQAGDGAPREAELLAQLDVFIEEHLHRPLSAEDLARGSGTGLGPRQLNRHLRRLAGTSLVPYLTRARLARARHLLARTGAAVREVAAAVGIEDPAYFNRLFVRHHGLTPARWRAGRLTTEPMG